MRHLVDGKIVKESKLLGFWYSLYLARYFCFLVVALVLSAYLSKIRSQLLVVALIMGIRWVSLDNYSNHKHIIILKGGEQDEFERTRQWKSDDNNRRRRG